MAVRNVEARVLVRAFARRNDAKLDSVKTSLTDGTRTLVRKDTRGTITTEIRITRERTAVATTTGTGTLGGR